MGQIRNVLLIIVLTAFMALGLVGATLLVDMLPIPAMHASTNVLHPMQSTLKSGLAK